LTNASTPRNAAAIRSGPSKIVREASHSIAETVLARMRREAANLGAIDEPLGDGAADESRRAGDQDRHAQVR